MNVLVTGATGNVGRACVAHFGAAQWRVTQVSREQGLDLTDERAVSIWAERQPERFGLVVMAHGVQETCPLDSISLDVWRRIVDGNLTSCAILSSVLKRLDLVEMNGLIVYCSSIQASQPREGRIIYAAAKAGLEGMMRAAAVEWADDLVRCVALRLGQLIAPMKGIRFSDAQAAEIRRFTPLPWVVPTDVAKMIFSLWGQESITGVVLEVSSGHHLSVWP